MAHPCRKYFQNETQIFRVEFIEDHKILITSWILTCNSRKFLDYHENARIDYYYAPDIILNYTNGNTCKNEFRRGQTTFFKNLNLISKNSSDKTEEVKVIYSYENYEDKFYSYTDKETEIDIPVGKLAGKSYKEIQDYKRRNRSLWEKSIEPSKEAVQSIKNLKPDMSEEEIEFILSSAYSIDF